MLTTDFCARAMRSQLIGAIAVLSVGCSAGNNSAVTNPSTATSGSSSPVGANPGPAPSSTVLAMSS